MDSGVSARAHGIAILIVVLLTAAIYSHVSGSWFCAYDDFNEAHRAAFEDSLSPARIFTTTHYVGFMYRPVTTGLQYLTWTAFHHSALAFRLRNLAMHIICVAFLYGIIWMIAGSRVALVAALLFGIHPLANETVVVAIWTNTTAYALLLASFFLFLCSLHAAKQGRNWEPQLIGALACAGISIFTYEPTIVVFGLIAAYLLIFERLRDSRLRTFNTWLFAGVALELALFFAVRHAFVTHTAPLNSSAIIVRNAAIYAVALLLPVDVVLAHALLGTPFPSEMNLSSISVPLAGLTACLVILSIPVVRWANRKARFSHLDIRVLSFLLIASALGVLPLLLFRDHASEHDLYLSAAFFAAVIGLTVLRLSSYRAVTAIVITLLALSFASGTFVRNGRVEQCATIAQRIISGLPLQRYSVGEWHVMLATVPGERLGTPYGIYNDEGLHALEVEAAGTPGAEDALQLAAGNQLLRASIVDAHEMKRCIDQCFWVSASGEVTNARNHDPLNPSAFLRSARR